MGLENLGLEMNRSAVVTDEHLRTNVEGVYAVGDVNGKIMLAHTAYREAEVAVNHILGIEDTMGLFQDSIRNLYGSGSGRGWRN